MTAEELLVELRDIAPPPEPGWWLIGPAWWAVAGAFTLALLATAISLRYRGRYRRFDMAARALDEIRTGYDRNGDARRLAIALSAWLKQVALLAFPRLRLEAVSGQAWLEFLDRSAGDSRFSSGAGRIFAGAVYRESVEVDADQLLDLCQSWLLSIKPQLSRRRAG